MTMYVTPTYSFIRVFHFLRYVFILMNVIRRKCSSRSCHQPFVKTISLSIIYKIRDVRYRRQNKYETTTSHFRWYLLSICLLTPTQGHFKVNVFVHQLDLTWLSGNNRLVTRFFYTWLNGPVFCLLTHTSTLLPSFLLKVSPYSFENPQYLYH